tara:strand:+ start:2678 stop:2917 length:240 start_codon:yes stop_codon:yes gene_type:complete
MLKLIIYLSIILAGIPTGIILKKLCKDETKPWKNRFNYISIISLILSILIYFSTLDYKIPISITLLYIISTLQTINYKK